MSYSNSRASRGYGANLLKNRLIYFSGGRNSGGVFWYEGRAGAGAGYRKTAPGLKQRKNREKQAPGQAPGAKTGLTGGQAFHIGSHGIDLFVGHTECDLGHDLVVVRPVTAFKRP